MTRAFFLLAMLAGCATPPSGGPVTAYDGARLIIGDGRVIENGTLLVQGSTITAVGRVSVPSGATRINAAGKTIMPMIVDTHVHVSPTREAIIRDLRMRAYYGVSAAMSLGTDSYEVLTMRAEEIPGAARFRSAGRGITMQEPGRTTVPYWVNDVTEARKAVAELAANKVDIVKIWVDTRDGKFRKLTPELYGAIIDEAHKRGLRVTAHIFDLEDAKGLIRAGVDALAHGVRDRDIDDELVAMFKQRPNLVLTPNLPERGVQVDLSWLKEGLSSNQYAMLEQANTDRKIAQQFFGIQARNLAKLNAAGARITLGTDGNRPWGPHEEMEDMVLAGMTPMQVIVAATGAAAQVSKLDHVGTIAPGKAADLLVLDANPLQDIRNTRQIHSVWLAGRRMETSGTN